MAKILNIEQLIKEGIFLNKNKKIGLITGCFDLLHADHINLFRFAKKHLDILIVAIESDLSIRRSKGITRPINTQNHRAEVLSELLSIDFILLLDNDSDFSTKDANNYYDELVYKIKPNYIFTNKNADKYWMEKKRRVEAIDGLLINFNSKNDISTTKIIDRIIDMHKGPKVSENKDVIYYSPL